MAEVVGSAVVMALGSGTVVVGATVVCSTVEMTGLAVVTLSGVVCGKVVVAEGNKMKRIVFTV